MKLKFNNSFTGVMPFGEFKGFKLSELPPPYVVWLAKEYDGNEELKKAAQEEFNKLVESKHIQFEEKQGDYPYET